jgi:hypothetical protein
MIWPFKRGVVREQDPPSRRFTVTFSRNQVVQSVTLTAYGFDDAVSRAVGRRWAWYVSVTEI